MRHHCFASPFVNPADERHNGKCDNAKNDTWQQCRHTWKKPDSNSHHREYQKSEDINREHHFAIDPACSSCLFPFLPHPPEVVPEIEPLSAVILHAVIYFINETIVIIIATKNITGRKKRRKPVAGLNLLSA